MNKIGDKWETPQWLFDELNKEFKFNIDLCSTDTNKKCESRPIDALTCSVMGQNMFMNPPYSRPYDFIKAAYDLSLQNLVVCLIKCDTSTKSWAIFYDYATQSPKPGVQIRYFPRRIKFEHLGKSVSGSPTFPSALIIMDRRGL